MRVLVTRATEDAARTAARLRERGHEPVLAPLTEIRPTGEPLPAGPAAALILTSAHAVAAAAAALPTAMPVLTVGVRTAHAAREAGFTEVEAADGDALALVRLAAARLPAGAVLLHARGRDVKPEPEAGLVAHGFTVLPWTVYAASPVAALPQAAEEALRAGTLGAVLQYSRRGAGLLLDRAREAGLLRELMRPVHACLSADVAEPLAAAGVVVAVAASPSEEALIAVLDRSGGSPSRAT
jgi:uroporphyrinogen-III synthase